MIEKDNQIDNQIDKGLKKLGLSRDNWEEMDPRLKRTVFETGCSAGGKRERVLNYDGPVPIRGIIESLLKKGLSPEVVYDLVFGNLFDLGLEKENREYN